MTIQVILPQMGESVFEATLTKWLKKVGDPVVRDEPLYEVSTDKVDSEVPSPASGILSEILVPEGKTIQVDTVVAVIREAGDEAAGPEEETTSATPDREDSAPLPEGPEAGGPEPAAEGAPPDESPKIRFLNVRTSPLVRKLARENDVDLSQVAGTGLEGRITREDLLQYLKRREETPAPQAGEPAESGPEQKPAAGRPAAIPQPEAAAPEFPRFMGESETVPMTPMRKAIAEHMVYSKRVSAHVSTVFEVDVSAIVRLREQHSEEFRKREGVKLTYTPFFAKALVDTVREFPIFNTSVSGESIIFKKPVHLGVAVALDTGLIVPVIRDAHLKNLTGMTISIHDVAERARTKRLKPEDVQNGTISITNPGIYGPLFATPIISQPQVAILGIGGITKRAVVVQDAIAIRSMVFLSLTFDHRVIDGAVADKFMAGLKDRLQNWTQWKD